MTADDAEMRAHNIAVIEGVLAAFSRLDRDAVIEATHPDLVFELPFERGHPTLDQATFSHLVAGLAKGFQTFNLTPVEIIEGASPDELVVRYEGDCLSTDGTFTYRNSYLGLFAFTDGRISRWREYANPVLTRKMNEHVGAVDL